MRFTPYPRGSHDEYTADEMMTVFAARALRDGMTCFVGIGLPSSAANLARTTHAPSLVLIYESGTIGAKPGRLPLSIGDGMLAETADAVVSVPEIFNYWLQPGRIDVGFLGAAQIDKFGNINTTVIGGDYGNPKVRLPGAGGAPEIAASCREVIVVVRQNHRSFVERVDFVTSVGYGAGRGDRERLGLTGAGPKKVITDLGVLEPDPETLEFTMTGLYPGVSASAAKERTGWDLAIAADPEIIAAPTPAELDALRSFKHGGASGDKRGATIDILPRPEEGDFTSRWKERELKFAVHSPRHPRASPRSHGVPRRDVPSRVHIGVTGVSAGGAPEDGLALARLRVHLPARRAALARERGFDTLHSAGSLLLQAVHQQAPPGSQDLPVEPGLLTDIAPRMLARACRGSGHLPDLEVFDADHVELAGDVCAGLSPPSPCVGPFRERAAGRSRAVPVGGVASRVGRRRAFAAAAASWSALAGSGQAHATVHPSRVPRTLPRPGRCPRPRRCRVPGLDPGWRRRRHASVPPGPW